VVNITLYLTSSSRAGCNIIGVHSLIISVLSGGFFSLSLDRVYLYLTSRVYTTCVCVCVCVRARSYTLPLSVFRRKTEANKTHVGHHRRRRIHTCYIYIYIKHKICIHRYTSSLISFRLLTFRARALSCLFVCVYCAVCFFIIFCRRARLCNHRNILF